MRGIPLRCPYLYTIKRNKSVSDFSCLQTYYTRRNKMKQEKVGSFLKELRKEKNITQEQLAESM